MPTTKKEENLTPINNPFKVKKKASLVAAKQKQPLGVFEKFSLEVVAGVVLIVALSAFVVYPTFLGVKKTQDEITAKNEMLTRLQDKNTALVQAKKLATTIESELANLNEAIPNQADFVEDFKILEKISADLTAQGYNFVIKTISLGEVPQETVDYTNPNREYAKKEMIYTLSLNADYQGIQKFVEVIGQNLRNFEITRVTFSSSEENEGTILDISLMLKTIYYGD